MHADKRNAEKEKSMDLYCLNSGQKVSEEKSSIFFSENTTVEAKQEVCQTLNIMIEALSDKYLGLPAMVGAERSECFVHLIDRVMERMKGWKEKLLSMGGKEVLIKSIAQSIPVYAMMLFNIPRKYAKVLLMLYLNFGGGDDDDHKKMHWVAWWKLCLPKNKGGMGISIVLILPCSQNKYGGCCVNRTLCARVLRAQYYSDGKLLQAKLKSGSSFTWQSVLAGLECFKRGCIWRVGDGTQIRIWEDNWIPSSQNMKIMTPRGNNIIRTVDELINPTTGQWDVDLINDLFWSIDAHRIQQIPLSQGRDDFVAWHHNRNGLFSVRSAYHTQWMHQFGRSIQSMSPMGTGNAQVWKKLWNLNIPAKIKIFGWRALQCLIPCGVLANRHITNMGGCPLCDQGCEDIKHMMFTCDRAQQIWQHLGVWNRISESLHVDRSGSVILEEIIRRSSVNTNLLNTGFAETVLVGGWYIWWQRRQIVHGEAAQNPARSALTIATLVTNYKRASAKKPTRDENWKKPPQGKLMLNVDASFDADTGSGSTGAIIRDSSGHCIVAAHKFLEHVVDATVAEAIALKDGLSLTQHKGGNHFIVQSDCHEVVSTMRDMGFLFYGESYDL